VPAEIRSRAPTTDTYSLPQTQEEFYFALPTATLDLILYAHNLGKGAAAIAVELGRTPDEAARASAGHRAEARGDTAISTCPRFWSSPWPELAQLEQEPA